MIFDFIKNAFGPDAGRKAMRASYEKHYQLAISNGMEPIACALYGALSSRYKLRRRFISELVHMVEISPFAMMDQQDGQERLADYVLSQEIPEQIDLSETRIAINKVLRERTGAGADEAHHRIIALFARVWDCMVWLA